ncbi:MAG: hypothetical protein NTY14_00980 [Candidatus Omnitrophica bacterium]|nr:hypothetical protein [Candidatus Omnitrophota bacterium]
MVKTKKKKKVTAKKKTVKKAVKKVLKKKPVKKVLKKKTPAKKPAVKKTKKALKPEKGFLGEITHYFPKVRAAVIKLKEPLGVGDKIKVKGHTTDFTQTIASLQIDRVAITLAKKGDEIGFQVESRVRRGDKVTKL